MNKRSLMDIGHSNKKQKVELNIYDPILLDKLGPYTYNYTRPNGLIVVYNIESLIEYLLSSGKFIEPESQIKFSDTELKKIDDTAINYGMEYPSILDAKNNKQNYTEEILKRETLLSIERSCDEFITQMLNIIESNNETDDSEVILLTQVFPPFMDLFYKMEEIDDEYAYHCIENYMSFINGPKNRPTISRNGLLHTIINFLDNTYNEPNNLSSIGF
jgi:hypothetical protein